MEAFIFNLLMEKRRQQHLDRTMRLQTLHKLKAQHRANTELYEKFIRRGVLLTNEEKKRRIMEIKEVLNNDRFGWKFQDYEIISANLLKRRDFDYIPIKNLVQHLGSIFQVYQCGEADLYLQSLELDKWMAHTLTTGFRAI